MKNPPTNVSHNGRDALLSPIGRSAVGEAKPVRADSSFERPRYSVDERELWRHLYRRQDKLLAGKQAAGYLSGRELLGLKPDKIPSLAEVSRVLSQTNRWKIARVSRLLPRREYFGYLEQRIFPCADRIRGLEEIDYAETPDCFQDLYGHAPMLMQPQFADFCHLLGRAARNCREEKLERGLIRIFRFSVQSGLILDPEGLKFYGKHILADYSETKRCLAAEVSKWPWFTGAATTEECRTRRVEDRVFVIHSFDELKQEFAAWAGKHGLL